jgi:hypothetical protein
LGVQATASNCAPPRLTTSTAAGRDLVGSHGPLGIRPQLRRNAAIPIRNVSARNVFGDLPPHGRRDTKILPTHGPTVHRNREASFVHDPTPLRERGAVKDDEAASEYKVSHGTTIHQS